MKWINSGMNAQGAGEGSEITMRALFPAAIERGSPCMDPFFLPSSRWKCSTAMHCFSRGSGPRGCIAAALAGIIYLAQPSSCRMPLFFHPIAQLLILTSHGAPTRLCSYLNQTVAAKYGAVEVKVSGICHGKEEERWRM